jgi:beta-phosphoglucomutase
MSERTYKAVLFDLDGVLVNMPDGHYEALNRALSLFGANIGREEHFDFFNGLPTRKKIEELERQGRLPHGLMEFINSVKQSYTKEVIPKYCTPDYSKILLLQELKRQDYRLACCSNSIKETLHQMLQCADIYDFFDVIIGNDEVKNPKPHPEIYETAMRTLGITPAETVIVEDSPHGIASAKAAGATVFEVRNTEDVNLSLFAPLFTR